MNTTRIIPTVIISLTGWLLLAGAAGAIVGGGVLRSPLDGKRFAPGIDMLFDTGGYPSGTIVRASHGRLTQIGRFRYPVWAPIPSPDSKLIEFGAGTPYQPIGIGVMNADGSRARIVRGTKNCAPGGWMPHRSALVLACGNFVPGKDVQLVMKRLDGTTLRKLGQAPPGASPSVNPRTSAIAICDLDSGVYVVDPGSGVHTRVASENEGCSAPAWSPDGTHLAFFQEDGAGGSIETVAADGSNEAAVHRILSWQADFSLSYSRDGKRLAFGGSPDRPHDLFVVNVDGTDLRRLNQGGDTGDPIWIP